MPTNIILFADNELELIEMLVELDKETDKIALQMNYERPN